ncbi:hypothetical protein CDD83_3639 [Cordyceps sp. RAO-2017]|nr:hypothetical protein CDD83_3639 [Cordyceps sp. RAO-2017]
MDHVGRKPYLVAGAVTDLDDKQAKDIPGGVVLDMDGKPCTSFTAWAAQTKEQFKQAEGNSSGSQRPDCPPDVDVLGRSSWTVLHSIAASYPERPSPAQQSDILSFVALFSRLYPCWICAEDFQAYQRRRAPRATSRHDFGTWLCDAHNEVNRKLGKPEFDCFKWEQRWRTGWTDGRCD